MPTESDILKSPLGPDTKPEDSRALLETLLQRQAAHVENMFRKPSPVVSAPPREPRGFRVRLDLRGTKPPVWRRLELPGDLTLPRLHHVIQTSMGWTDSHLHRFRVGGDYRSAYFVTDFDVEDGEEGLLENDVRLDQLVAGKGDRLWYEYDFGDGWDHVLTVEAVLGEPPAELACVGGRGACPPEDCGGVGGYSDLAAWVRSGFSDALLPDAFESPADARDWLPPGWHPDHFTPEEVEDALTIAAAEPVAVTGELADLFDRCQRRGVWAMREVLARPALHDPTEVSEADAARLTQSYREFLDVIGDGVKLTGAGYLPPHVVESFAGRSGVSDWWIGKANREDLTPPVRDVRDAARALGLVSVRKGRLSPTAAGSRLRDDPLGLLQHIVGRLPAGTSEFERQAGWLALAVAGSGAPAEGWRDAISHILQGLGWHTGRDMYSPPSSRSETLTILEHLAGAGRTGWRVVGTDLGVAAAARATIARS